MAARFLVTGGDGNWTSTNNWSATSGGGSGVSAPGSADDVTFDTNSGATNITLDTAGQNAKTWTVTAGYTGTITFTNTLTVAGSVSLGANMHFAGAAALIISTTATLTFNGKTLPQPLTFSGGGVTYTMGDSGTVTGGVNFSNISGTVNGNTLNCGAGLSFGLTTGTFSGTTNFVMNGTGTLQMASVTSGTVRNNIEINTAGTVTLSGTLNFQGGIIKYTSGTLVTTGATVVFKAAATLTVNNAALSLEALSVTGGTLTCNGSNGFTTASLSLLSQGSAMGINFLSTNNYNVTSSLILAGTSTSNIALQASSGGSAARLTFTGGTMAVAYVNATDIDSSLGRTLYDYGGTLLRATNWTTGTIIGPGPIFCEES